MRRVSREEEEETEWRELRPTTHSTTPNPLLPALSWREEVKKPGAERREGWCLDVFKRCLFSLIVLL